jgi:hypothetical protein
VLATNCAEAEVHLTPELEKNLSDIAAQTGCETAELVQDALARFVAESAVATSLTPGLTICTEELNHRRRTRFWPSAQAIRKRR